MKKIVAVLGTIMIMLSNGQRAYSDLRCIQSFFKKNDFENYMIDGWDGGIWTFTFYEAGSISGEELFHGSFSGGNNALDTFRNVLEHYSNTVDFYNADGDAEPALN